MTEKVILDLCGGTGSWSKPYHDEGYEVIIVDKDLPDKSGAVFGDVALFEKLPINVVGILCAPPCTKFAISGNRWKRSNDDYTQAMHVVDACLRLVQIYQPEFWALEQPVGKLIHWIGKPKMYFQPCDYGDPWTKKTCLWGNFNIPKKNPIEPIKAKNGHHSLDAYYIRNGYDFKKTNRARMRSISPPGFAQAFYEANKCS